MTAETMNQREGRRTTDWLCLAATPAFAIVALFSGVSSAGPQEVCGMMHGSTPLSGMAGMYVLMSVFHSTPWLNLLSARIRRI